MSADEKVAVTNKLVQPEIDYIIGGFRNPITHALRGWTVAMCRWKKTGKKINLRDRTAWKQARRAGMTLIATFSKSMLLWSM